MKLKKLVVIVVIMVATSKWIEVDEDLTFLQKDVNHNWRHKIYTMEGGDCSWREKSRFSSMMQITSGSEKKWK